ncbi:DUF3833 family protein [Notoacmeibacter sp. MSK16QG-6]|uniref:DUF3833 family protein n=1 Tax=Notoacmeibacter sp. MSK16QG-6 TaxID=2957982 RepID=UPI00209EA92E|nr:DUF3833 family protein [Notoacmeibacter sp. MSK16QG-6]MCP1200947.1 DUF3833 domain-containing protein [Notoacmeibacter sp. MSK16QG-6]
MSHSIGDQQRSNRTGRFVTFVERGFGSLVQNGAQYRLAAMILALGLTMEVPAYAAPFDLFSFFDGKARSEGTVNPLIGKSMPFTARFSGKLDNGKLRLVETFTFPDGEFDQIWDLRRDGITISGTVQTEGEDGELSDTASVNGQLLPEGAMLTYDGYAPGGGDMVLSFTHRMTARSDGTVANDVTISKFFLPLARSKVTFYPDKR